MEASQGIRSVHPRLSFLVLRKAAPRGSPSEEQIIGPAIRGPFSVLQPLPSDTLRITSCDIQRTQVSPISLSLEFHSSFSRREKGHPHRATMRRRGAPEDVVPRAQDPHVGPGGHAIRGGALGARSKYSVSASPERFWCRNRPRKGGPFSIIDASNAPMMGGSATDEDGNNMDYSHDFLYKRVPTSADAISVSVLDKAPIAQT